MGTDAVGFNPSTRNYQVRELQ